MLGRNPHVETHAKTPSGDVRPPALLFPTQLFPQHSGSPPHPETAGRLLPSSKLLGCIRQSTQLMNVLYALTPPFSERRLSVIYRIPSCLVPQQLPVFDNCHSNCTHPCRRLSSPSRPALWLPHPVIPVQALLKEF